jgi:hypothetical protein
VQAGLLDRLLIARKNVSCDGEQHFDPSFIFYRIPERRDELVQQESHRAGAQVSRGFLGVIRECLGKDQAPPAPAPD